MSQIGLERSSASVTLPATSSVMSRRHFLAQAAITTGLLSGGAALFSACGDAGTQNITLQVMYDDANELSKTYGPLYHKLNPNVTIKVLQPDQTHLSAMFAAGNPPDVVRVSASDLPTYAARGLAANITSYIQNSSLVKTSDLQPINDLFRWNGKVQGQGDYYGLVKDWSIDTQIWYNKKLFDQAGVPYPSATEPMSFEQMLSMAKKLTVRQGSKIQIYGLDMTWEFAQTYNQLLAMVRQDGASFYNADMTKADFAQPAVKKALQWFVDWAQARVGPSPLDVGDDAFSLFAAERLAMVNFGYWFGGAVIGTYTNNIPDHVGLAIAPQWGAQRVLGESLTTGFFITNASKQKDATWKFLEWFVGGQPGVDHSKTGFGIPPLKHLFTNLPQGKPWQKQAYQTLQADLTNVQAVASSPFASSSAVSTAIQTGLANVIKGQSSLDEATAQMNNTVNLLIQQGQSQAG